MTGRALLGLIGQNLRRGRRNFVLSTFGIAVGIASLAFFLALSAGVRRAVLGRVFPVGQLEVVPAKSNLAGPLSLLSLGGPRPLTDADVAKLRALAGVRAAWPRMRLGFAGRAWGGHELLGKDIYAELIAEGVDAAAMRGESIGPEPFSAGAPGRACSSDAECGGVEYCPADVHRCERPVPAVISPFILELYNSAIAPAHGLPKIGAFLASRFRGFTFNVELGRSYIGGGPSTGAPPRVRRVMLVGISPHAAELALTLPLAVVRRWNAEYAGPAAARQLSSVLLELAPGASVTRLAAAVRALGFEVADSGAERAGLAITLLTILFALISVAIVALAALNIAHGFYRAVAERRREIGVLRSVGASAADVRRLLLGEAAAIGLCGGVGGLGVAWLGARAIDWAAARYLPDFPFKPEHYFWFDWRIVSGALLCSILACMAGALWPARAAARLDPTDALKG